MSGQIFKVIEGGVHEGDFKDFGCKAYTAVEVKSYENQCGVDENLVRIRMSFLVDSSTKILYETCFDPATMRSVWARHILYNEIEFHDTGTSGMPDFTADNFFPDFDVANAYTKIGQRDALADILGSEELANQYVDVEEGNVYLARGHLAPRADFFYKSWQRMSYKYINTAPQWQCFNSGNWNYLESAVREMVENSAFAPFAEIYTGTFGILKLLDINDNPTEIWLSGGQEDKRLPVPTYFWKIVYEPETQLGVALIGVNNPHLDPEEVVSHKICPEISDHPLILELSEPDSIIKGICYACSVPDAQKFITDMPQLEVVGVLMKGKTSTSPPTPTAPSSATTSEYFSPISVHVILTVLAFLLQSIVTFY